MKKETKLLNKLFKEYCFSNETIACHHLNIEKDVLRLLLAGKESFNIWKIDISYIEYLINTIKPTDEISTLEEIIFHLTMMNNVLEEQYYVE